MLGMRHLVFMLCPSPFVLWMKVSVVSSTAARALPIQRKRRGSPAVTAAG